MPARVGVERRNAHQPMHAGFGLRPAMRIMALDEQRAGFDARFVAGRLLDDLDLEFVALGPAGIHAKQHARPVAALGAAGPGVNLDIGVVGVDLARQQRFDLAALGFELELLELPDRLLFGRVVLFRLGQVRRGSTASSSSLSKRAMEPSRSSSSVRSRMIFCAASALFQRFGSSTLAFSSARRRWAVSTSKMPPQQSHGLLDGLNQRFGFGAHYFSAFGMGDGASRGWREHRVEGRRCKWDGALCLARGVALASSIVSRRSSCRTSSFPCRATSARPSAGSAETSTACSTSTWAILRP